MAASRRIAAFSLVALAALAPAFAADEPTPTEIQGRHGLDPKTPLESRVKDTPEYVVAMFKDAFKVSPKHHPLTEADRATLKTAIDALPPLHRRILAERLRSLSFLDDMPNTALTSTIKDTEPFKLFDITINASILRQTASEWLTQKERSCFDAKGSNLTVSIDAGATLPALAFVLLHEATHVLDASLKITPTIPAAGKNAVIEDSPEHPFSNGVWTQLMVPVPAYRDPYRGRIGFYTQGGKIPIGEARAVYESLRKTPFVSLYGSLNWTDDLAEYVSVYQFTEKLKQPYRIVIRDGKDEVFAYEPMNSDLVRKRVGEMNRFYVESSP